MQKVAAYKIFCTLDLTSAYHQVELPSSDGIDIAFEADGVLWQWKRIPFGLTNAVPCFQRIVDDIIKSNNCEGTFAYVDNITVGGVTRLEHGRNLAKFLVPANDYYLTFNETKCTYIAIGLQTLMIYWAIVSKPVHFNLIPKEQRRCKNFYYPRITKSNNE